MLNEFLKKFHISIIIFATALIIFAQPFAYALDYIESSSGLSDPQWEGGHTEIEMADIDGDGNLDLLSIGDHGSPYINTQEHGVMVYFGSGYGAWSVFQNGNFGYGGIAIGDCNNDGFADIGYAMHHDYSSTDFGDQLIEVALGDGTGQNWTPWDDNLASQGEDYGMFATDLGDIDNDGDLDIASTSFGYGNDLMVYRNRMDGTWEFAADLSGGNCGMVVQFGDINNDGNLDLATSYQNGTVYFGSGTGTFINADYNLPSPGSLGHPGVSLGDVDNDGGADLSYAGNGGVKVWVWDETLSLWVDFSGSLPASGGFQYTQLCDMNSDGFCDVVAGGDGRVVVWTGDGGGNWTPAANYIILNDPGCDFEFLRAGGDVDHNGFPDIVHLTDEGGWINSYNHLRLFKESTPREDLTIASVYPRGNENLLGGSVRFIDWLSEVPRGETAAVDLEFSSTGASGPWEVIAENLPNNGRYQWIVPEDLNSTDCFIRYTAISASDTAQATNLASFSIYRPQDLASIDLTPLGAPITIPAGGGDFDFEIELANIVEIPCSFDAWIDVILPGGTLFGPILLKSGVFLNPQGSVLRLLNQSVPGTAPPGTYTYQAHIGVYANGLVWAEDSFNFEKSAVDFSGNGSDSWILTGWGDGAIYTTIFSKPPVEYQLFQNYPNPFNPTTTIGYQLTAYSFVELGVYDIQGREVARLVDVFQSAGIHRATFDGSDLSSGIYFARLRAEGFNQTRKILLVK